jgi:hypothetical protein
MLNWEQIAERIQNPLLCNAEEIPELKDLCEKYPYSQVFPMLYLKVLSDVKYIHFEEELEKYAYRITDRVQLYNLLYSNYHTQEHKLIEETVATNYQQGPELENEVEEILLSEENLVVFEKEQVNTLDLIHQDSVVPENDDLDEQILAATIGSSYQIDDVSEDQQIESLPVFDLSSETEIEIFSEEDFILIEKNESKSIDLSQNRSFIDWLKISSNSEFNVVELENQFGVEDDYEVTYIEFEKPKKEFFSPVKKAKESLSEDSLPVSETLAKIYEVQGNIPKSIFVYEQLSLIIPEKKTYFASQIKKLKKKLN